MHRAYPLLRYNQVLAFFIERIASGRSLLKFFELLAFNQISTNLFTSSSRICQHQALFIPLCSSHLYYVIIMHVLPEFLKIMPNSGAYGSSVEQLPSHGSLPSGRYQGECQIEKSCRTRHSFTNDTNDSDVKVTSPGDQNVGVDVFKSPSSALAAVSRIRFPLDSG